MYTQVCGKQLHEAVEKAMLALNEAHVVSGENQDMADTLKEISLVMDVEDITNPTISKSMPTDLEGLVKYDLEFLEGVRDFEPNWEYTYHRLFAPYLDKCIAELSRENSTRRAVLPVCGPLSYGNTHPPCLQVMTFKVVGGKLQTTAFFRSNDGVKAFQMNCFAIIRLSHYISEKTGIPVGGYTHIANSFHAYHADWETLEAYCRRFTKDRECYFEYGDYLEVYDECAESYRKSCAEREALFKI